MIESPSSIKSHSLDTCKRKQLNQSKKLNYHEASYTNTMNNFDILVNLHSIVEYYIVGVYNYYSCLGCGLLSGTFHSVYHKCGTPAHTT